MWRSVATVVGITLAIGGVGTLVVADSPYDPNVVSERNPLAPERPATLDRASVREYTVAYEETRLRNDLLRTRGYTIDLHDSVRADCSVIEIAETGNDEFRVLLRCRGGIDDALRLLDPSGVSYTVAYRVTGNATEQVAIEGYPFAPRDELDERPASA